MITSNFGKTQIKGNASMILSDFSCIVDSLKDCLIDHFDMNEEKAKEAIQYAYETGFMNEEELDQEEERLKQHAKELLKDAPAELAKLLESIAEVLKGGASE